MLGAVEGIETLRVCAGIEIMWVSAGASTNVVTPPPGYWPICEISIGLFPFNISFSNQRVRACVLHTKKAKERRIKLSVNCFANDSIRNPTFLQYFLRTCVWNSRV